MQESSDFEVHANPKILALLDFLNPCGWIQGGQSHPKSQCYISAANLFDERICYPISGIQQLFLLYNFQYTPPPHRGIHSRKQEEEIIG